MSQLSARAAEFIVRITGFPCRFILNTDSDPYVGGQCTVFALEANGERIGIRIDRHCSPDTRAKVEKEIELLQAITRERIRHLPQLIGYDLEAEPPMVATSWADGDKLEWADFHPPTKIRKSVLKTIAEVTLDLLKIQEQGEADEITVLLNTNVP